jgi:hypothetical protein
MTLGTVSIALGYQLQYYGAVSEVDLVTLYNTGIT